MTHGGKQSTRTHDERIGDQIRRDYEALEPAQHDAWNPLRSSFEMVYRLCLLHAVAEALRLSRIPIAELAVLDVGCGNGRSARMYLDLGLKPPQIVGLDLRTGAIELARKLNPAIRFESYEGGEMPFPDGAFTWVHVSTVLSSIKNPQHRADLVRQVAAKTRAGGHVFYFDLVRANAFAGRDLIRPERLFEGFDIVHRHAYDSWRFMQELDARRYNPLYLNYCRLKKLIFRTPATHEMLLLSKRG